MSDLSQILQQGGMQIPVLRPEELKAQEEADARQARIIGLNTAMALVNGTGAKLVDGHPIWLSSHTDFMASAKEFRGVAEMFAQYVLKGVGVS